MRRPEPARERLLTAAAAAFARAGFEGASTRAIAKAAGVPQGLVRHHFGSKDGLWSAVLDRGVAEVEGELASLASGVTVAAWTAIVERHVALAGLLVHALLEGGPRAEQAAERAAPVWRRLRAFVESAQPYADGGLLPMWLFATAALPLLRRASGDRAPLVPRWQEIDRLFAWLCGDGAAKGVGAFAVHAARSRLRGAR